MSRVGALFLLFISASFCYYCQQCNGMCCNIPGDHKYYLTDFCDGYPHDQTSCGEYCDDYKYFTADRQRFGCNGYLTLCRTSTLGCIRAKVIDAGPAYWVEEDAGMPIIDASPDVCSGLFGVSSCGWSDHFGITAVPSEGNTTLGFFQVTEEELKQIIEEGEKILARRQKSESCN